MFILLINFLVMPILNAQDGAVKAPAARSAEFKKDEQGRPYFTDKSGDKIIILDSATRKDFKAISSLKKNAPLPAGEVDPKSFYKETVDYKITEPVKPVFKTYKVVEGDTWESISQKIYGTPDRWPKLKIWNEELLKDIHIPAGSAVKYLERY